METVVVTGFRPFGSYAVNASWEAVKLLPDFEFEKSGTNLIIEEIPVAYEAVTDIAQQIQKYNPTLVVHVGVSAAAKALTLETAACKKGYERPDVQDRLPEQGECSLCGDNVIKSGINVEDVCKQFNGTNSNIESAVSIDAGRFLCEFTYYCSLSLNKERTIFIHVPDIGKPYTSQQTAIGLKQLIDLCLDQVKNMNKI